ncbi:hypothetical protein JTB14_000201 [Gonioctena quinquepunctata]|nr:hypothetical protein JTB14_000201 [Gonioctena quinquepunctata]
MESLGYQNRQQLGTHRTRTATHPLGGQGESATPIKQERSIRSTESEIHPGVNVGTGPPPRSLADNNINTQLLDLTQTICNQSKTSYELHNAIQALTQMIFQLSTQLTSAVSGSAWEWRQDLPMFPYVPVGLHSGWRY